MNNSNTLPTTSGVESDHRARKAGNGSRQLGERIFNIVVTACSTARMQQRKLGDKQIRIQISKWEDLREKSTEQYITQNRAFALFKPVTSTVGAAGAELPYT